FSEQYGDSRSVHSFPTRRSSDLGFGPISQTYWRNLRATASAGDYEGRPAQAGAIELRRPLAECFLFRAPNAVLAQLLDQRGAAQDRKSTRLNSSHVKISYAVFCL